MRSSSDAAPELRYLSRADVARVAGDGQLYLDAVRSALATHARGDFTQPLKPYLRPDGGRGHVADRIIAMPAYFGGDDAVAGIKWVGSRHDNPGHRGLERASALIVLSDPETHYPVAILEGGLISGMRTAAVTVIACEHLARPGFRTVGCLGCGPIARMQLETLTKHFPTLSEAYLYDLDERTARNLAVALRRAVPTVTWCLAGSAEEAVRAGDVVLACTVAEHPYVPLGWLSRGAFVSNVSLMDLHKDVYLGADKVVVDDWEQSNRAGKVIYELVQEGRFSYERLHAELGDIVTGRQTGRENDDELIVLNPMGMALTDLACAAVIYRRARGQDVGTRLPR